jgi:putative aldouronate transport system substrate-binding protein
MLKRRWLVVCVITVVSAIGVFAGAQQEKTATEGERPQLSFLFSSNVDTEGYDVNDNPYLTFLEDQNDVDLTLINAGAQLQEKLNTVLASGDLPDYMQIPSRNQVGVIADQGFLVALDDRIPEWPNLSTAFRDISWKMASLKGTIYAVPFQRFDPSPFQLFARRAWVENLGIDVDDIKTTDDWYQMLSRFTFDDPDGNGRNDTWGWLASNSTQLQEAFLDAFDGHETRYVDGEVRPYYISPGYKEWLKWMARLVEDGIMDPEFATVANQKFHEKMRTDKYGAYCFFWHINAWVHAGRDREEWTTVQPPLKPDGTQSGLYYPGPVRHYIGIATQSDYPNKVLQIFDWGVSDAGGTFMNAGLAGMDYDVVDGKIKVREERKQKLLAFRGHIMGITKAKMDDHMRELLPQVYGDLGTKWLAQSNETGRYDELYIVAPSFPELADYDLDSQMMEFRVKAILGQVDVDSEWDGWVARWRRSGGDAWIKRHTEWYENEYKK